MGLPIGIIQQPFKQDIFGDIGGIFSEITGFGGSGDQDPHNMDPDAYAHLYNEALAGINAVGADGNLKTLRDNQEQAAITMLGDLQNNAEGRKQNFMEDMARGFQADVTNRARAAGGTGNLAQSLSAPGSMYDSQARATSRGLNDLYGQAIDDLGGLSGIQQQGFNQDFSKATSAANLKTNELANRRGIAGTNLENTFNSEQAGRERRGNTIGGIFQGLGQIMGTKGSPLNKTGTAAG